MRLDFLVGAFSSVVGNPRYLGLTPNTGGQGTQRLGSEALEASDPKVHELQHAALDLRIEGRRGSRIRRVDGGA